MTVTTQKIYGVCPHDCPDSCGVVTEVENGRAVKFYGTKEHPVTQGWLCTKVRPYLDFVYHPDRLTTPLRRTSAKTDAPAYAPITWDEALDEISHKWQAIIDKYGAEAILPYSFSGTLGTMQNYISGARFWNRMGASQLERSICGAAAAHATIATLGDKLSPPHKDVVHSKVIIIWGHNPVSTGPHFMPFLTAAKRQGTQVVVIDPRRTRTAKQADWHIAPKAATDGALAMALAHVIFKENLHDPVWMAEHVLGGDAYQLHVADCTPEWAAEICDIPAADIVKLARLYAENTPSLIKTADGVQRHTNGGQSFRAMLALPAITGQYGKLGGGFSYSSGGFFKWDWDLINRWDECPKPGRWVNMNRLGAALTGEIQDPPIMSLYVFAANPLGATANAGLIQKGLEREDLFTVVHELFMTDTADFADIVLPATSQLEQIDIHRAYGNTVLSLNDAAIPPLGDSRSNWDTFRALSTAMGFTEPWLHDDAETVINELLANGKNAGLAGVTTETLRVNKGMLILPSSQETPWQDGVFGTPSGKVELYSQALADEGAHPLPTFTAPVDVYKPLYDPADGLNLISGASHYAVSTSFGNSQAMLDYFKEQIVEINPKDAAVRGIADHDWVEIVNERGCLQVRAKVTDAVRPGVVVSPKGPWAKHHGGKNINWITPDTLGDMAGQSTYHTNMVWLKKVGE